MVGRTPPGFDSAGVLPGVVEGDDCKGCVACATCVLRAESWFSERPEITSPPATSTDASQKSLLEALFLSSGDISITAKLFAISTETGAYGSAGTCYSASSPASPSSAAKASSVPLAFQANPDTGSVPFLRTRISAPSCSRTIRMVPSL